MRKDRVRIRCLEPLPADMIVFLFSAIPQEFHDFFFLQSPHTRLHLYLINKILIIFRLPGKFVFGERKKKDTSFGRLPYSATEGLNLTKNLLEEILFFISGRIDTRKWHDEDVFLFARERSSNWEGATVARKI